MSDLIQKIKSLSDAYFEEILEIRRHIHSNPELSFQEHNTASFIEEKLKSFGLKDAHRIAETGVTFCLEGKKPGKTIALRADIDALPITEANDVPYKSKNEGVMHACGHDVHTSNLLGVAKILSQLTDKFEGTIKFIFQPAEEKSPGGASILIKEGILENPTPETILGQHVMPLIPEGKVGFRSGKYMASADEVYLTVKGKGGHAAMPETFVDPIAIASQIIVSLQQIVSRIANPKIPSVLSFGKIAGGNVNNVIPDEVKIDGTFRTFDEDWRKVALQKIKDISTSIASSMGGSCEVHIASGYPFLVNDEAYTKRNVEAAKAYMGEENVVELDLWMAAEDFAFYTHQVPGCFYRLGTRNEAKGITSGVHTPTFNIDENALKTGMGLMAYLAINELNN
ncbi:amidohydrolase [Ekhidna lutea]|uniref:Amidohydrolase n=1 Tax=Ekhidna lutea TaxID=447679 RepID=A0A239KN98_EKHLU|nr:M20 family metallopeptidase [Ekhidna lutea]SNT19535.1 amidohydrolase [Ekhidna lutea]